MPLKMKRNKTMKVIKHTIIAKNSYFTRNYLEPSKN